MEINFVINNVTVCMQIIHSIMYVQSCKYYFQASLLRVGYVSFLEGSPPEWKSNDSLPPS